MPGNIKKNTSVYNIKTTDMRKLYYMFAVLVLSLSAGAQQRTITGRVLKSTNREPLAGATVSSRTGSVTTDSSGTFSIRGATGEDLTISFIGMTPRTVKVPGSGELTIELQEAAAQLEQVVVTGYQTQRKVDLTGAVSVVNLNEVKDIPTGNPMRALQGRVPGLYIEATGRPNGTNNRVLIRGLNTLGDPNPLYVIDGVPTKDPQVFASLNPGSIASVQVLKDASAASIYGSRASNGVIIVTTKEGRGRAGQERISVQLNSNISVQTEKPWREDVLTAEERGRAFWRASVNDRTNPTSAIYTFDWNGDFNNPVLNKVTVVPFVGGDSLQPAGNTNWQAEVYKPALVTQQDLTLTAGTGKSSLLINLGYFKNTGMMVYTNFERISTRINAYTTFLDGKIKIGENLQLARSTETLNAADLGGASTVDLAISLAPTIPVFRKDGTYAGPI
ncbi:MAG: TonB-dependent receptor plug domain-containing protein, partial [Flavisolibacter sp.]|nr:TonB-dependent receptor plug domain-containing protein [Flavisolibacter sp.]